VSNERPTSRSWVFVRVLRQTADALKAANVPFLVAGGLAAKTYGKRRTTHDIDLFVKPSDARRALEALARAGFETKVAFPDWLYKAFKYDVMVDIIFRSEGNITVDDETLQRARLMEYRGRTLPVVPPEVLMLMKIFALRDTHAANTHWRHWRDAVSVARNVRLDWDFLRRKALQVGPRPVLGFLLLAEVEGVKANDATIAALAQVVGSQASIAARRAAPAA
jgi:hypothetical protein